MNYNNIMKIIRKYFHSIWKLKAFYINIRHWNNLHILHDVTMQYIHIHPLEVHSRNKYIYLKPAAGNRSVGYDASCLTTESHNFHLAVIAIISAHFRNELLENVLWLSLETFLANFFNNSQVKCVEPVCLCQRAWGGSGGIAIVLLTAPDWDWERERGQSGQLPEVLSPPPARTAQTAGPAASTPQQEQKLN